MASPGEAMDWTPTRPDAVQVAPVYAPITQPDFGAPAAVQFQRGSDVVPSSHHAVHSNLLEYTNGLFPPSMRLQGTATQLFEVIPQVERPAPKAHLVRSRPTASQNYNRSHAFSFNKISSLHGKSSSRQGYSLSQPHQSRTQTLSSTRYSAPHHLFGPVPQPKTSFSSVRVRGSTDQLPSSQWAVQQSRPRTAPHQRETASAFDNRPNVFATETTGSRRTSSNLQPHNLIHSARHTENPAESHPPIRVPEIDVREHGGLHLKPVVPYFSLHLPKSSEPSALAQVHAPSARRRTFQEFAEDEPEAPLGRHPTTFEEVQRQSGVIQWVKRKVQSLGQRFGKKIASIIKMRRTSHQLSRLQENMTTLLPDIKSHTMPGTWPETPAQEFKSLPPSSSLKSSHTIATLPDSRSLITPAKLEPASNPTNAQTRDVMAAHEYSRLPVQPLSHSTLPSDHITKVPSSQQLPGRDAQPTAQPYSSTYPLNATQSSAQANKVSFSNYQFADPRMRRSRGLPKHSNSSNSRSASGSESQLRKSSITFAHTIKIGQSRLKQMLSPENNTHSHGLNGVRNSGVRRPSPRISKPAVTAEGEFSGQPIHIYPSKLTRTSIFHQYDDFDAENEETQKTRTGGGRSLSNASSQGSDAESETSRQQLLDYSPQLRASLDTGNAIRKIPSRDFDGARTLLEELEFFQISEEAKQEREERQAAKEHAKAVAKARREAEVRARKEREEAEAALLHQIEAEKQKEAERLQLAEEEKMRLALPKIKTKIPDEWEEELNKKLQLTNLSTSLAPNLTRRDLDTLLPQGKLTNSIGWLNDEIVNSFIAKVIERLHAKAGFVKSPSTTPPYHAFNTFFFTKYSKEGYLGIKRWMERAKIHGDRLLRVKRLLIPINHGSHWTLVDISGTDQTITYYDSMGGDKSRWVAFAKDIVSQTLGNKWVEEEWKVLDTKSPRQTNGIDCGVFVCLNGLATLKGAVPIQYYREKDIPAGRRMIAAVLLHGGFQDEFDL